MNDRGSIGHNGRRSSRRRQNDRWRCRFDVHRSRRCHVCRRYGQDTTTAPAATNRPVATAADVAVAAASPTAKRTVAAPGRRTKTATAPAPATMRTTTTPAAAATTATRPAATTAAAHATAAATTTAAAATATTATAAAAATPGRSISARGQRHQQNNTVHDHSPPQTKQPRQPPAGRLPTLTKPIHARKPKPGRDPSPQSATSSCLLPCGDSGKS